MAVRRVHHPPALRGHRPHRHGSGVAAPVGTGAGEPAIAYELTWHARSDAIPEALWRECFAPPWEGRFWFSAIESGTRPGQFAFSYGLLRRDGVAIGIVPAFAFDVPLDLVMPPTLARLVLPIARGPLRGLAHQRTLFIGNVAGEEGHVGLRPGERLGELAAFVHAQARLRANALGAPMLVWKDFPASDREALDALAAGTHLFRLHSYPGTAIAIAPGGFAEFLAGMRSDRRRKIVTKLRRGKQLLPLDAASVAQPGPAELAEIFALFAQTRARATTRFEDLTPAFFQEIAAAGEATFVTLRARPGGALRAFMLMLRVGNRAINQFIGLDYAAGEGAYLYFQLFEAAYDWACASGATAMHSGQTGYMAKLDLGHTLVPLWNFAEHRNAAANTMFRLGAARIGWNTLDPQLREYLRAHPELEALGR